ncbi:TetR/AcrR family transcriptional regulator [Paractinoplanes brasiliensis]|uniref:TetR family transcriptional regulator n=1 Tax=Paractinoplanes brasiliensis TaxID=52695 RepID=A0A4R6JEZ6_9ACTN|nr:TetR/AcrR family transcriptional regulator [Actinoplanes brasiliensis]TDO33145.1 TetR family transcriptional regulator [Actinoplanes brasiliensis]GID28862.1 TetR family transcriptional regulator [Actinoplanes brasiliensis]
MEKAQLGRPRAFDADAALGQAMLVFWRQGFEGASLADLTEAMGISRKSMYAAYGNKEELFRKVLQRYTDGPAAYIAEALSAPTARETATAFLTGSIRANTMPGYPAGCLGVQGALAVGETGQVAHDILTEWRAVGQMHLRDRFRRAVREGDLPADADPDLIARYLMTIANGLAVQASAGAGRQDLERVAGAALRNWPPRLTPDTIPAPARH